MTKRLIPFLAFLFSAFLMMGQSPQKVFRKKVDVGSTNFSSSACADQDAGDVQEGTFTGASNDTDFPQVYFCFGDEMNIDHIAGTADLTGDPILATTAGLGYALYSAMPTIGGPDLDAILLDPNILTPLPPPPAEPIWMTFGDIGGNATFNNDGGIQTFFNGGAPIEVFFAPITVDDFQNGIFEQDNGSPAGPCTRVSIDQAFSVVYLNEITINGATLNGTTGSFTPQGGLSEFDGLNYNSIVIENAAIPGMMGSLPNPNASHNDVVSFTVPQEGTYNITVTDDKGCSATTQVVGVPCSGLELIFEQSTIAPNGLGCISLITNNFDQMLSLQFTINYDPAVINFNSAINLNPLFGTSLDQSNIGTPPTLPEGIITFSWFMLGGTTLPDGENIFDLCFDAVGSAGDFSSVNLDQNAMLPNPSIEAANTAGMILSVCETPAIIEIGNLTLTPTVTGATCFGDTDGEIDFTISGGNAPYTYTYVNLADATDMGSGNIAADGGMDNLSGLDGGASYQITVMDASNPNPETLNQTIMIPEPSEVGSQLQVLNPTCAGDNNGNISLTVFYDGFAVALPSPDFSILWNNMETTANISNLPAAFYEVTVTHIPTGCTGMASTTLANPAPIDPGFTSQIATCAGFLDGSMSANPSGGMAPYMYNWDSPLPNMNLPSTNATVNGLDPGRYYLTITDSSGSGCVHIDSIDVGATTIIESNAVVTDVSCFGADNGSINLTPSAIGVNNGGYSFDWNDLPGVMNPEDRMMLDGNMGTAYEVTITDAAGCELVESYDVVEPDQILITLDVSMNETCVVGMDGSATISVTGGVGTLNYDWGTTPNQTTPMATNLVGGDYTVTVSDMNGCLDSLMVTILPPDPPIISLPDTSLLACSNSVDGSLEVIVVSTTSPVTTYAWSPNTTDNTAIVNNLGIGTYFVTVTTADGCTAIDTSVIASPNPITLLDSLVVIPTCPEDNNGAVNIIVEGGTAPYVYNWSTGFIGSNTLLPGLMGDSTYCATITDSNQCEALEVCVYLPIPPPIQATFTGQTLVSCNDGNTCDATAIALVSGGTGGNDYDFTWASNEVDSIANALCAGWNTVSITDGVCGIRDSVFIDAPDPLSVDVASIVIDEPTCFGATDGGASLMGDGGTPQYDYVWSTGSVTNSIFDVPAGSYNVTITDTNGCIFQFVVPIAEPDSLIATIDLFGTSDALCFGEDDGDISVVWSGGNSGPAMYEWTNNVSNTSTASGLPVGTYNITVTDINGCSDTTEHVINQPPPIMAVIPTPMEPECFGFQTFITLDTVFGGNPGLYTYSVDNGPQQLVNAAIPVFADLTHTISIFDSEGCRLDTMLFINQPDEVIVNLGPDVEIQLGDSIQLEPLPVSALAIDSIFWTPADFLSCTDCFEPWSAPLSTQEYTFTIIDINGCMGSDDIIVDVDKNRNIYIPNIFSPNGDGFNDIFKVESGPGVVDVNFMYIFDRWGEQLFERNNFVPADDISGGWDGTFKGKEAPTGVYVYIIEVDFADGITLLYRGDITIIR